jgi:tRNA pseudouridine32 synthase/23S rRNA pseudouridine746 synthase
MNFKHDEKITESRSPRPSYITLPALREPLPQLLDFFEHHFPRVGREIWRHRLQSGKIFDEAGQAVTESTPYRINARLGYYREVESEPVIPFQERILFEDDEILIADKPHFLPVTPSGSYVNECLLHRLMKRTGNEQLVAVHRLDRETAGLVLFSKRAETRHTYSRLFKEGLIDKQYEAIALLPDDRDRISWLIESRIERGTPHILFRNVSGEINARSRIDLVEVKGEVGMFKLSPLTGKTHQLRLHMGLIGSQILNDKFYPELLPEPESPDYTHPLQLLARTLCFNDPLSGKVRQFESTFRLTGWPA